MMTKKFELQNLVTRKDDVRKIVQGEKSVVRRSNRFGNPGDKWERDSETFELVEVYQQKLGDMTEEDAQREGYTSLDEFIEGMTSIHAGSVWDPEYTVWVHHIRHVG